MTREEAITKLVAYAFWASEHVPDEVAQALDMAIEAMKERPQWIPVTERLPEDIGDYLVTEKTSNIARAVYTSSFGHIRTGELCFYYEDDECRAIKNDGIVAWMPLPNPYWEEGE